MRESSHPRAVRVLAVVGAVLAAAPSPTIAQTPLLETLGAARHHAAVDAAAFPWSSVVKLFNSVGGACTGAVIAADMVLTAAHCLYGFRTHRFLPAEAIHVLVGYSRGEYRVHARVARYRTGPGYDPANEGVTIGADWAVLTLADPLPPDVRPLRVAADLPAKGMKVMLGGFGQDRAYAMTADTDCTVLGAGGANRRVFQDCAALPGDSGGPLLDADPAHDFAVYGVEVAVGEAAGAPVGIAVLPTRIAVGLDASAPAPIQPP